jgi:hypothetical protein
MMLGNKQSSRICGDDEGLLVHSSWNWTEECELCSHAPLGEAKTLFAAFGGHRAFVTRRGLIGRGAQTLRKGDFVCVLFGAKQPFLLRNVDHGKELLGALFIYDLSHGEVITAMREHLETVRRRCFSLL